MGVLTSGQLNLSVFKLKTTATLEHLFETSVSLRYPIEADHQSSGWGSLADDEVHTRRESVKLQFAGGAGRLVNPKTRLVLNVDSAEEIPNTRLELRYYYDEVSGILLRQFGDSSGWEDFHVRRGFDVLILNEGEEDQLTALVSTRDGAEIQHEVEGALKGLLTTADPSALLTGASLEEELEPDFFLWLEYRQRSQPDLGEGLSIPTIREMNSLDGSGGRARISKGATTDRVEIKALITKGRMKLGPAKLSLHHEEHPESDFDVELFGDGGFAVFRTTEYKDHEENPIAPEMLGRVFAEDFWRILLPKLRRSYQADIDWPGTERPEFIAALKAELDAATTRRP